MRNRKNWDTRNYFLTNDLKTIEKAERIAVFPETVKDNKEGLLEQNDTKKTHRCKKQCVCERR